MRRGIGEASLREIAAEAGSSHRMLIYHFGSRDGLLAAVVGRVEEQQRAVLATLPGDVTDVSRLFWQRLTDPALAPAERLFFEIYARALHDTEWSQSFREAVIDAWERPLVALYRRLGARGSQARAHARLGLAVTRGLILDLLLTGDRAVVDGAMERFGAMVAADLGTQDR